MGFNKLVELANDKHNINTNQDSYINLRELFISDSYYSLVNGYQKAFESVPNSEKFSNGISLSQLDLLYFLETNLSATLFQNILFIEKRLKTALQYVVSKHLGTDAKNGYLCLNKTYYVNEQNTIQTLGRFLKIATGHYYVFDNTTSEFVLKSKNSQVKKGKEHVSKSLKEYRKTGNVPPWILINDLTFGETLKWYNSLKNNLQQEIIFLAFPNVIFSQTNRHYDPNNLSFINNALTMIKDFRNGIAHGDLLNKINLSLTLSWSHISHLFNLNGIIIKKKFASGVGKNDLLSIYLIIFVLSDIRQLQLLVPSTETLINQAHATLGPSMMKPINRVFNIPDDFLDILNKLYGQIVS